MFSKWCQSIRECKYEKSYLGDGSIVFQKKDSNKLSNDKIEITKSSSFFVKYSEEMVFANDKKRKEKESKENNIIGENEKMC